MTARFVTEQYRHGDLTHHRVIDTHPGMRELQGFNRNGKGQIIVLDYMTETDAQELAGNCNAIHAIAAAFCDGAKPDA